uniref:Uncharacterized protein n=1 Tax=Oryza brachyantha TaxID=4533 RepID=J3N5B5_ORYBR
PSRHPLISLASKLTLNKKGHLSLSIILLSSPTVHGHEDACLLPLFHVLLFHHQFLQLLYNNILTNCNFKSLMLTSLHFVCFLK